MSSTVRSTSLNGNRRAKTKLLGKRMMCVSVCVCRRQNWATAAGAPPGLASIQRLSDVAQDCDYRFFFYFWCWMSSIPLRTETRVLFGSLYWEPVPVVPDLSLLNLFFQSGFDRSIRQADSLMTGNTVQTYAYDLWDLCLANWASGNCLTSGNSMTLHSTGFPVTKLAWVCPGGCARSRSGLCSPVPEVATVSIS